MTLYDLYSKDSGLDLIYIISILIPIILLALLLGALNAHLWVNSGVSRKFKATQMVLLGAGSIAINEFYLGNHFTFVLVWWSIHWIIFESFMYRLVNITGAVSKYLPFGYSGTSSFIDELFYKLGGIGVEKDYPDTNDKIYRNSITYKRAAYFFALFITIPLWLHIQFNF